MRLGNAICTLTVAVLAACGGDAADADAESPPLTAASLGDQVVLAASDYLALPAYAGADAAHGRQLAFTCRACHTLEPGGVHMIGPNLNGMFGEKAGTREGFDYSEALRAANFVWTPRALDAWLKGPGTFLPGNKMSVIGVSSERDRRDLIAYLLVATETDNR